MAWTRRYDCPTGFVITRNGRPHQAMMRRPAPEKRVLGIDDGEYWLATLGEKMSHDMIAFLVDNFKEDLDREWESRSQI